MHSSSHSTLKGIRFLASFASIFLILFITSADDKENLYKLLHDGEHFAIMRHALAPGTGDPDNFQLDDCSSQRNLSQDGRNQAKQVGEKLKANGIESAQVYSSQWCRCLETAKLLNLGPVEELPIINSFFRNFANRTPQTRETIEWISEQDLSTPTLLVTHQVNITALIGTYPASGEIFIVLRQPNGDLKAVHSIDTD
ncbi:histidine phosphatase family protein [Puniceicoccaceae bacterium K14]|nr:histidine phosphatase family protein [Puniceicoccaceae bacterium K14]